MKMNEDKERKRALEELRQRLRAGEVILIQSNPPAYEKREKTCEKCGSLVNSTIMESNFVCCPNCGYPIWFNRYIRVPDSLGRLPWYYIEDDNGNTVRDYTGKIRLFESEDAAKKYVICCDLDTERAIIKYFGKV